MSCDIEHATRQCGRRGQLAVLAAAMMLVMSCQGSTINDEPQAGGGGAATTSGGIGGSGGAEGPVGGSSSAGGAGSIPCPETVPSVGESCTQLCQYVDCEGVGITVIPCVDGVTEDLYDPVPCGPISCDNENAPQQCAADEVCVEQHSRYTAVPSYGCYPYPCDDPGLFTEDCARQICDSTAIYPYLAVNVVNGPRSVSCYMTM